MASATFSPFKIPPRPVQDTILRLWRGVARHFTAARTSPHMLSSMGCMSRLLCCTAAATARAVRADGRAFGSKLSQSSSRPPARRTDWTKWPGRHSTACKDGFSNGFVRPSAVRLRFRPRDASKSEELADWAAEVAVASSCKKSAT